MFPSSKNMDENRNNSKDGMVNHAFSIESNSEDEGLTEGDLSHSSFTPKHRDGKWIDATKLKSTAIPDTSRTNATHQKSHLTQELNSVDKPQQENGSDSGNHHVLGREGLSTAPGLLTSTTEDQQNRRNSEGNHMHTSSMIPEGMAQVQKVESAFLISNGTEGKAFAPWVVKNSSDKGHNEKYMDNSEGRDSKDYFRDVRLTLDAAKPVPTADSDDRLVQNSDRGSRKSSISPVSYSNDSSFSCDCVSKVLNRYKLIVKYVVQRPLFCFSVWTMLYIFWGDDALPGGPFFALTVLVLTALFLGYVAELMQLPGLLGMVAAGIILRNVPYIDVAKDLEQSVSSPFRALSIVILLVKGALGVNLTNIVKFKHIIPPLVIGSCIVEAIVASVAIYLILDFPVAWASLMGCIISAMSSAAVVPCLGPTEKFLSLKADPCSLSPNYQKAIAIVRTSCGLDAMISICLAEVALGFIVADGEAGEGLMRGAVEVIMGGAVGIAWGLLAGVLLDESHTHEKRVMAILSCSVMSFMGFPKIGYGRAAPLAVFAGVLITNTIWKKKMTEGNSNEQLAGTYAILWYIFQPLLFGIIGARTNFDEVDWSFVGKGVICLVISMLIRLITTFLMTTAAETFTLKERLYVCIAWIPKGTVQAALAPAALDTIMGTENLKSAENQDLGYKVMHLSVVSFIGAALLGCLCLRFVGPRLLS